MSALRTDIPKLDELFAAKRVAIVGASDRPGSWGNLLVERMVRSGFEGPIYPINPRCREVLGLRAYGSVKELPHGADLAIIMVSPARVVGAVEDCAHSGVPSVIALTTGFAESGSLGAELEDRIARVVDEHNLRFIGPNCIGVMDRNHSLNFYFRELPAPGDLTIIAQGGGIGVYMCEFARRSGIGIAKFVSLGNQLRTDLVECANWAIEDDDTRAVALYVEGAPRSRKPEFMRLLLEELRILAHTKPVVIFHGGQTPVSAKLAYSHTAALATSGALFAGACRQYGLHLAATPSDAVTLANLLASQRPHVRNRTSEPHGVAIVASGSQGMYIADLCYKSGLGVPDLPSAVASELAERFPELPELRNPLDFAGVTSSHRTLPDVLHVLIAAEELEAVVYALPSNGQLTHMAGEAVRALADELRQVAAATAKPLIAVEWLGPTHPRVRDAVQDSGQILTEVPEEGIRLLLALSRHRASAAGSGQIGSATIGPVDGC